MIIGIVGSEQAKFTPQTEAQARNTIRELLQGASGVSSGHCHLGGVDIFAEEIADELGIPKYIFPPKTLGWEGGYKPRNIKIAKTSDKVYCITLKTLPPSYQGMRFNGCYHCGDSEPSHVKSGGCWTVKYARKLGKPGEIIILC